MIIAKKTKKKKTTQNNVDGMQKLHDVCKCLQTAFLYKHI